MDNSTNTSLIAWKAIIYGWTANEGLLLSAACITVAQASGLARRDSPHLLFARSRESFEYLRDWQKDLILMRTSSETFGPRLSLALSPCMNVSSWFLYIAWCMELSYGKGCSCLRPSLALGPWSLCRSLLAVPVHSRPCRRDRDESGLRHSAKPRFRPWPLQEYHFLFQSVVDYV